MPTDLMTEDEVIDHADEVGCWVDNDGDEHHGIACDHPTCSDCGAFLDSEDDDDCEDC